MMQTELTQAGPLLQPNGQLSQVGWSRQPLLDCNLESARFYTLRPLQRFRIKRWDYYAVFTPRRFFSATIADLGYAGNIFVYTLDFETGDLHEEGLVIPLGTGIELPRNSTEGEGHFENKRVRLRFSLGTDHRHLSVSWPDFHDGRGIEAKIDLAMPPGYESMNIVIPIGKKRFYYNRKVNCLPASGTLRYGDLHEELKLNESLGSLDGSTLGLNMGLGFGDLSAATENAFILDNRIHKLDQVKFDYVSGDYMQPWHFTDNQGLLDLIFTPFKDRLAKTNLGIITSEVHQMFGRYDGHVTTEEGDVILVNDLIGFAEEHHARW
jgi:hypothetical protein